MKRIHIIGGGTFNHVRTHLSLAAPAFGQLARQLAVGLAGRDLYEQDIEIHLHLTRMAFNGPGEVVYSDGQGVEYCIERGTRPSTNADVMALVDALCTDPDTAMIFLTAAICDFDGQIGDVPSSKTAPRLMSREGPFTMGLTAAEKILTRVRASGRDDIFLVSCKTTDGVDDSEMVRRGLASLQGAGCDLVLVNDVKHRRNCIVNADGAVTCWTYDRPTVVKGLIDTALSRAIGSDMGD